MNTSKDMFSRSPDRIEKGVLIFNSDSFSTFERRYLKVREKEQRIHDDEFVRQLPEVPDGNSHYGEWLIRKHSTENLIAHIRASATGHFELLDLGCGNGWFAHHASQIPGASITALDVNMHELVQGQRVFNNDAIRFCYGDLNSAIFRHRSFDYIVLNCMVQYFPDLSHTIDTCLDLLSASGELHIVDSPFYEDEAVSAATQRSREYYSSQDCEEMAEHYFHHRCTELAPYRPRFHYDPRSVSKQDRARHASPFPWISIQQSTTHAR